MPAPRSAGVLLYRPDAAGLRVLLVHPGGPYWRKRDAGAWQLPKGGIDPGEDAEAAARREAHEELGVTLACPLHPLGSVRQSGGKWVEAFACAQDVDVARIVSTRFDMEWPPRSGRIQSYPEVDAARWFTLPRAAEMMLASQRPFLARLETLLAEGN